MGVTGHARSPRTILGSAREREGRDRNVCSALIPKLLASQPLASRTRTTKATRQQHDCCCISPGLLLCKSYSLRVAIWPARAFRSACFTRQPTWILFLPLHRHSLREGMEGCTLNTAVWCCSSESPPLSQPRRTLGRARQHTHVPHPITPLPPASFV